MEATPMMLATQTAELRDKVEKTFHAEVSYRVGKYLILSHRKYVDFYADEVSA